MVISYSQVLRKQRQVSLRVRVDQQKVLRKVLSSELMEMFSQALWQKQRKVFKKAYKKVCRKLHQAACQRAFQNLSRYKSRKAFKNPKVSQNQFLTHWAHQRPSNHRAQLWVHRANQSQAVSKSLAQALSQLSSKWRSFKECLEWFKSFPLHFNRKLSENLFENDAKRQEFSFVREKKKLF